MLGISQQNRDRLAFLLRDPFVRIAAGILALFAFLYMFPILPAAGRAWMQPSGGTILLLTVAMVAFQSQRKKTAAASVRIFWNLLTVSVGFWVLVRCLHAFAPGIARTIVPDILIAFFYFFFLAAADRKPHKEEGESHAGWSGELAKYGRSLITVGLLVYFALLPSLLPHGEGWTWLPSLAFIVAMDLVLVLRFGHLWKTCSSGQWKTVYGLLVVTVSIWIGTDFSELLSQMGILHWERGGWSDLAWIFPHLTFIMAARVPQDDLSPEEIAEDTLPELEPVESLIRSRSFLVAYAVALPVMHFGLYSLDILDPVLRDSREVVVLLIVLVLGTLALADRVYLERRSRSVFQGWKLAEGALRSSERRYRALVENGQGLICTHDLEENFLSVNPAAAHLLGYGPEEMVGKNFREFLAPWSLERIEEYLGHLKRDKTDSGLLRVLAKDGTERVWIYQSTLFHEPGQAPVVLGHAQDITERIRVEEALRRSEAKFRTLVEDAPNAIVITSLTGQFVQVNRAAEKMFGYASDELLEQGIELLIPERFHQVHRQHLAQYAAAPQPRPMGAGLDLFARRKDGSEFPVEIGLGIFETEEGMLVGATVLDITDRKEVEKLKDELISMVSHELRTPLTSIRGSLGLLAAGLLGKVSGKAKHMLEVATNNTDRLVRLINDILDIQRMEAGRVAMVPTACNAAELMDSVRESMQPVAEEAGVTLQVDLVSAPLWADHDRIIQVLTNLISNGIKFSSEGGTVRLLAESREQEFLFQVKDEGRGIPSHQQEAVFDRFQQVDVSDARVKGGAGLGLAISRKIVEEHGGRIWVESAPGQGSTFSFTLPLKVESPVSESV